MPVDVVQSDGKREGEPHMAGSGSGFDFQDGKTSEVLVQGDAWDAYFKLKGLLDSVYNTPVLDVLNNQEIRNFKSFRNVIDLAGAMTTETMRMHVLAYWRAIAEGILKMPIGPEARMLIKTIDGGRGVR